MSRTIRFISLLTIVLAMFWLAGCEDAAEDALEELTGYDWELSEDEFEDISGVDTPGNWYFMFAVNLGEDEVEAIDQTFSVDISMFEDVLDLDEIEYQVVFAKAESLPNGAGNGLRYANKVLVDDGKIKLDGDTLEKLGPSIGSSGAGWYAAYFSGKPVGYITGTVTDCDGSTPSADDILVTASDGPFFTFAVDGSWALPSLDDKPAMVNFDAGDCAGSDAGPVTDTEEEENPKDPGTEPPNDPFSSDDTNVVAVGETNLAQDQPGNGTTGTGDRYEFDDAITNWGNTGDCFTIVNDDPDAYGELFPGGTDATGSFAYISTGSPTQSGLQACTVMRTFNVSGYNEVAVGYDFLSQEYAEWVGSPYNDIFTMQVQGDTGYIVHRTINGENNWEDLTNTDIGFIADSADAAYNTPANELDGHLVWEGGSSPRGEDDDLNVTGSEAVYALPEGATTITILITISDVADAIYDSVAAIDYIEFR
ncbi:MAG TPA: choice-of-anchor L domain-containing protein [bacterium]|nr:choice-of-anchor L domain-containing protein [bacterium]